MDSSAEAVILEQKFLIEGLRSEISVLDKQLEQSIGMIEKTMASLETAYEVINKLEYRIDKEHGTLVIH